MAGQVDDCSSRFRISPNNAQSIRFQTMLMGDLVTATNAFELLIEAPSDCVIEMIDCTGRPGAFKNMFNIPNTTRQAKLINVSACTSAGDANGKILAGAGIADDNVISQANYGLAESRITGESGFNSVSGTNTSVTQNVWERQ